MNEKEVAGRGIRYSLEEQGREIGHAYLYLLSNDLHEEPFGLLEDVQIDEGHRGQGAANSLVKAVIERAQHEGCYKLIATSRNDGTRQTVHDWYLRLGFRDYGSEFRLDF